MIRTTSREAYHSIQPELGQRQQDVLEALKRFVDASNLELSKELRLPINSITPRIFELRDKGLVEESRRGICPDTGKKVIFWKVKEQVPLFSTIQAVEETLMQSEPVNVAPRSFFEAWRKETQEALDKLTILA